MSSPVSSFTPDQIAEINNHNLQGFFELVYIREANNMISYNLASLSSALNVSIKALNALNTLQDLHNQVTVNSKKSFTDETDFEYDDGSDPDDYQSDYSDAASSYFGTPIDPVFIYSSSNADGFDDFAKQLKNVRKIIEDTLIPLLEDITPPGPDGEEDPTTLLANLRKVLDDIPSGNPPNYDDCKEWALDNYDVHSDSTTADAGDIQNRITSAITAAESLNNTQSERVRSYLFIFEEYYKSAGAGLQAINQILSKMAENIAR